MKLFHFKDTILNIYSPNFLTGCSAIILYLWRIACIHKMSKTVAIIFGGDSAEYVISEKSAKVVHKNLSGSDYTSFLVEITKEDWSVMINSVRLPVSKDDFSFVKDGVKIKFDLVFNAIHGTPGEDGKIQGYFDLLGIPYNNSGVLASSLTFNKWACNSMLKQHGIRSAESVLLLSIDQLSQVQSKIDQLGFPLFVKPNEGGSSFGISKVAEAGQLKQALEKAFQHGDSVIIEEFIKGTEVTSGVIKMNNALIALPLTEIVPDGEFFDYEAKYEGKSQEITPARISETMTILIQDITKTIYKLLHLKGMIRADYLITEEGNPYLIEVNTVPGLSEESIIPQQAQNMGITLQELFSDSLRSCEK